MNAALVAASLLLAAGPARPKLVVLDLVGGAGIEPAAAQTLTETVAAEAGRRGVFEVISSREVASLIGLERQKALLGCSSEASSCLAELSGALGADLVLSGTVARMGEAWTMTLQTVDARSSKNIGRAVRIAPRLSDFTQTMPYSVAEATALPPPQMPSRALPVALIAVGGAVFLSGAFVGAMGGLKESEVASELSVADTRSGPLRPSAAYAQDASLIRTEKTLGLAGLGVGAALIAGGVVLFSSTSAASVAQVAVLPSANGVFVAGTF